MDFFSEYVSNTLGASGNQSWFAPEDPEKVQKAVIFFKLFAEGCYHYSLLYSNIIDGTFADGSHSHCNELCDTWTLHSLRVGLCDRPDPNNLPDMQTLSFDGSTQKTVMPGAFFYSDPVLIDGRGYLAIEVAFSGKKIPNHPESVITGYVFDGAEWKKSINFPYPSMIGCDRPVKHRICYLGDSITQGCGTPNDAYAQWSAVLSEKLGTENAYWDIGLGYGRAHDAASDGVWLYKAKQNDIVFVCYGVNDLFQIRDPEVTKNDLTVIVRTLKKNGVHVVLQTVPPFDYGKVTGRRWRKINDYLKNELAKECDLFFDNVPVLGQLAPNENMSVYGGHPDVTGCRIWAETLYPVVRSWLETM